MKTVTLKEHDIDISPEWEDYEEGLGQIKETILCAFNNVKTHSADARDNLMQAFEELVIYEYELARKEKEVLLRGNK